MIYAYLIDGLDYERRQEFDRALNASPRDEKAKASEERQAIQALVNIPGVATS